MGSWLVRESEVKKRKERGKNEQPIEMVCNFSQSEHLGRIIFLILSGPIKNYFLAGEFGDSKSQNVDFFFPSIFSSVRAHEILGKQLGLDSDLSYASVGRRTFVLPEVHGGFYCARVPCLDAAPFQTSWRLPPPKFVTTEPNMMY